MPSVYPFGGVYDPLGYTRRNGLLEVPPVNPLPDNAKRMNTGNAGADGYTVLSRADRWSGERPISNAEPFFEAPHIPEESGT
jgi:hypothetical protein